MATAPLFELPSPRALQSDDQLELLDIVDSLRAEGLGELTALPQLIVCGDQSSGKSSVLEAISGLPFPRKENLCTRFATEVILRRSPEVKTSVRIVPSPDRIPADKEKLQGFRHVLGSKDEFPHLFDRATQVMFENQTPSFSKDILRIELHGPSQPQLTLVDLPGLIHSNVDVQGGNDVELVSNLVDEYLQSSRSIILAVVSAKYDIGNQAILERARKVDPQRYRTLGIITKPDTLERGSEAEKEFIKMARNEKIFFRLGWHVVRNIDTSKQGDNKEVPEDRDGLEDQYFNESTFRILPTHDVRIQPLRARLSKILFRQIRLELPKLIEDIKSMIENNESNLKRLGPSRVDVTSQRRFLVQLSQDFQNICQAAVRGDYNYAFFNSDTTEERRLCAKLMNLHLNFARTLEIGGCEWIITEDGGNGRHTRTREQAITEACKLLRRSRGRELPGLPNPLLVGELFREYSTPWEDHAQTHIKRVWDTTNDFLELLLQHLTDDEAREKILRLWLKPIMAQKLEAAQSKLKELLEVHKDHPMTTNNAFMSFKDDQLSERRAEKVENILDAEFERLPNRNDESAYRSVRQEDLIRIVAVATAPVCDDLDMMAAEEAFDNMNAYYKVAMNLFMDNVPNLAVHGPIVRNLDQIFCPKAVLDMEERVITKLAAESEDTESERNRLTSRLRVLNTGLQLCEQYAMRPNHVDASELHRKTENDIGSTNRQRNGIPVVDDTVPSSGESSILSSPNHSAASSPRQSENHFPVPTRNIAGQSTTSQPVTVSGQAFGTQPQTAPPSIFSNFSNYASIPTPFSTGPLISSNSPGVFGARPPSSKNLASQSTSSPAVMAPAQAVGTQPWTAPLNSFGGGNLASTGGPFGSGTSVPSASSGSIFATRPTQATPPVFLFHQPNSKPSNFPKAELDLVKITKDIPASRSTGSPFTVHRSLITNTPGRFEPCDYHHLCYEPTFREWSPEEIRLADYASYATRR